MANSDYAEDVEIFWLDRFSINEFKKAVTQIQKQEFGKTDANISRMGAEVFPYFDILGVKINPTRKQLIKSKEYHLFLKNVLDGIKPFYDTDASSSPRGKRACSVLLTWMSHRYPTYAHDFLTTANAHRARLKPPKDSISFRSFVEHEDEDVSEEASGRRHPSADNVEADLNPVDGSSGLQRKDTRQSSVRPTDNITPHNFGIENWLPPLRLPLPRKGEVWATGDPIEIPNDFELFWAPKRGVQTYRPQQLIWARDHLIGIVGNIEGLDYTRLIMAPMHGSRASFIFKKQTKKSLSTIVHIRPVRADSPDFVFTNLSGVFFVAPDYSPDNYIYSDYGRVHYLTPEMTIKSDRVEKPNQLPSKIELTPDSHGIYFSDGPINIAVEKSGTVFQQVRSFYDGSALGKSGKKCILWRALEHEKDSFRKGSRTPLKFEPRLLSFEVDSHRTVLKFSPSGNYVLTDGAVASLKDSALLKEEELFDSDDVFHPELVCRSAAWHPTKDFLAFMSYKNLSPSALNAGLRFRIEIWCIESRRQLASYDLGHKDDFLSLDWSPDGLRIAASNVDGSVTLIDLAGGKYKEIFIERSRDGTIKFSPDGKRLAMQCKNEVVITSGIITDNEEPIEKLHSIDGEISMFVISPWHYNGKHIAACRNSIIEVHELKFE